MALTDIAIRNAKPAAKPVKIADGAGCSFWLHRLGEQIAERMADVGHDIIVLAEQPAMALTPIETARQIEAASKATQAGQPRRARRSATGIGSKPRENSTA